MIVLIVAALLVRKLARCDIPRPARRLSNQKTSGHAEVHSQHFIALEMHQKGEIDEARLARLASRIARTERELELRGR